MSNDNKISGVDLVRIWETGKGRFRWCHDAEEFMVDNGFAEWADFDEQDIIPVRVDIPVDDVVQALLDEDSDLSTETIEWAMEALGIEAQTTEIKRVRTEYVTVTHYGPLDMDTLNQDTSNGEFNDTTEDLFYESPKSILRWAEGEKTDKFYVVPPQPSGTVRCPQCHHSVPSLRDRQGHKMDCSEPYST